MKFWEALKVYEEGEVITDGEYRFKKGHYDLDIKEENRVDLGKLMSNDWFTIKYETQDSYYAILKNKESGEYFPSSDTFINEEVARFLIKKSYNSDISFVKLIKDIPELVIPKEIEV